MTEHQHANAAFLRVSDAVNSPCVRRYNDKAPVLLLLCSRVRKMMNCKCASWSESRRIPSERVLVWRTLDGLNSFSEPLWMAWEKERQKDRRNLSSAGIQMEMNQPSAVRQDRRSALVDAAGKSCIIQRAIREHIWREWVHVNIKNT